MLSLDFGVGSDGRERIRGSRSVFASLLFLLPPTLSLTRKGNIGKEKRGQNIPSSSRFCWRRRCSLPPKRTAADRLIAQLFAPVVFTGSCSTAAAAAPRRQRSIRLFSLGGHFERGKAVTAADQDKQEGEAKKITSASEAAVRRHRCLQRRRHKHCCETGIGGRIFRGGATA